MSLESLVVNEVYLSVQGESTFAGLPCVFIRLTACNLRCSYCDTAYAFTEGARKTPEEILSAVERLAQPYSASAPGGRLPLIEFTGGEPLLQKGSPALMRELCDRGFTVLVETSGAIDISPLDPRVRRIMDLKCPSSGEVERNLWSNLAQLRSTDEIKFVIGTEEDYAWMKEQMEKHRLSAVCPILVSWVHPLKPDQQAPSLKPVPAGQTPLTRLDLVNRMLRDALPARFQLQMHKVIWPPEE
ncbi:MAG: radical SAM protein, partial [Verrucomicrobia bacterium]|nr:radical SAM protein [Verrucomicrobiota bacterium]